MMTRMTAAWWRGVLSACVAGGALNLVLAAGGAELGLPSPPARTNAAPAPKGPLQNFGVPRSAAWTVAPPAAGESSRSFTVEISGFSAVDTQDGCVLHIPGEVSATDKGTPAVPRVAKLFTEAPGCAAVLRMNGASPAEATNISVAAAEDYVVVSPEGAARRLSPVRRPSPDIYARDQFWPPELGRVQEAWIGTQKVVRVECFPIQYNPVRRTIRWYRRLEGTLVFEPVGHEASP